MKQTLGQRWGDRIQSQEKVCRKSGKVGEHGVADTGDFVGMMARSWGGYLMASVFQGK